MRPADWLSRLQRRARFETFEERLVMSAQPAVDPWETGEFPWGPQYVELASLDPISTAAPTPDFQLEPTDLQLINLQAATAGGAAHPHALTGVDYVFATYGFTGAGQTVAVIDSGIAWDHAALGGGLGVNYRVVGGYDFAEKDANPYDDGPAGFHGTHVAGIIGSSHDTHRGVAPAVNLVGLRVFDDQGRGYFTWVEQALQWVHQNRNAFASPITTVNLSLGTIWNSDRVPAWSTIEDELAQLKADGIFVAVSAGNFFQDYLRSGLSYPAASSHVVPVASVDANGSLSSFSQRHARVLAAPGRSITSTVPDHAANADGKGNDFAAASGTSMAAPYAAGVSVLVRQAMEFAGVKGISQQTIYDHLRQTADLVYDSVTRAYYHRINVQAAIDAIMPADDFGSTVATAHSLGQLQHGASFSGVIGTRTDSDYFSFVAGKSGRLEFSFNTTHDLVLNAQVVTGTGTFQNNKLTLDVQVGQQYVIALGTSQGIGYYQATVGLTASSNEDQGTSASDDVARRAYELDQQRGLRFTGRDHLNWGGKNEKWLQGNDGWYFITPDGNVYRWAGRNGATGTLVATLNASYYQNLSLLYDAQPPNSGGSSSNANGSKGSSNTGSSSNANGSNGSSSSNSGTAANDMLARARQLDAQYRFYGTGNYHTNWAGLGEKWFQSESLGWVFITPDGKVRDWNGQLSSAARSPLIAELDSSFHADPRKLTDPPAVTSAKAQYFFGGEGSVPAAQQPIDLDGRPGPSGSARRSGEVFAPGWNWTASAAVAWREGALRAESRLDGFRSGHLQTTTSVGSLSTPAAPDVAATAAAVHLLRAEEERAREDLSRGIVRSLAVSVDEELQALEAALLELAAEDADALAVRYLGSRS